MEDLLKSKWLALYDVAENIGEFLPWDSFSENCSFCYINKDGESAPIFFTFIGESIEKCGIACYIGEKNYYSARQTLTKPNTKYEPQFLLQNGFVCIWDNREDLEKESYNLIKELGFKFRGKGSWLHFERYETGYYPAQLSEEDVEFLTEAFGNLFMMMRAVFEENLQFGFDKGETLLRWYEPKDEMYYTTSQKIDMPEDLLEPPMITIDENADLTEFSDIPVSGYSVELDWSYFGVTSDDKGQAITPLLLLGVEKKSTYVLFSELISPDMNKYDKVFITIGNMIRQYGRPAEIAVCEKELYNILLDFCKKVGIELKFKKKLPEVQKARLDLIQYFIGQA